MTKLNDIYKCNVCGNIVQILHTGAGTLVCCNQNMVKLDEKNKDEGIEKHLPVISNKTDTIEIKVGEIPHPMEKRHFIEWIEVQTETKVYRKYLKPEDQPTAEFKITDEIVKIEAYCNVHGLWEKQ